MLTREQILSTDDRRRETVTVPEWGGDVILRELSLQDRAAVYNALQGTETDKKTAVDRAVDANAEMLVRSVINEDGTLVFKLSDAKAMAAKSNRVVETLVGRINALNRLGDLADIEKN